MVHFFVRYRFPIFIIGVVVVATVMVAAFPAPHPQGCCDFSISLEMEPPQPEGMNPFYTVVDGVLDCSGLYAHEFYYVCGGKQSVKHTALGFEPPVVSYLGLEADNPGEVVWLFVELRCVTCGHEARAWIERPLVFELAGE